MYGLGRFPVTLYKEQWITLLAMTDDIRAFLTEHDAELKNEVRGITARRWTPSQASHGPRPWHRPPTRLSSGPRRTALVGNLRPHHRLRTRRAAGWRKHEILDRTWEDIEVTGGVIRLSPGRSKTLVGRILPISPPIANALNRRRARRDPDSPLVFHRDDIPVRRWRTAWRTACQAAGVPTRFLHDCRRTAARNLIRANVPERVAMLLTGHKSRAIFDRYNIINEQELLDAGDQLVAYLAQQAQAVPARGVVAGIGASPHRSRSTVLSPTDAVRHWPATHSHLIQDVAREVDLSPPPCGDCTLEGCLR